ncbi:MAG: helicase HerA-like domain-containing protein, partial [Chitinophaga sp.]
VDNSKLVRKYNTDVDEKSAYEILTARLEEAAERSKAEEEAAPAKKGRAKEEKGLLETIMTSSAARQAGRTAANMITRSLLGALGLGGRSRKKSSWF